MKNTLKNNLLLLLFLLPFFGCNPYATLQKTESALIVNNNQNMPNVDSAAYKLILPYKNTLDKEMNEILIISETAIEKGTPEGLLNNLCADIVLIKSNDHYAPDDKRGVDICLLNNGGLRTPLPKGNILRGKIFELMPFDNEISILTITGKKTKDMLDYVARKGGVPLAGVKMKIKDAEATSVFINGKALDTTQIYKVVTSDYLANGGDNMSFFATPIKRENIKYRLRDAIIEYLIEESKKGNKLSPKLDGRIEFEK